MTSTYHSQPSDPSEVSKVAKNVLLFLMGDNSKIKKQKEKEKENAVGRTAPG